MSVKMDLPKTRWRLGSFIFMLHIAGNCLLLMQPDRSKWLRYGIKLRLILILHINPLLVCYFFLWVAKWGGEPKLPNWVQVSWFSVHYIWQSVGWIGKVGMVLPSETHWTFLSSNMEMIWTDQRYPLILPR